MAGDPCVFLSVREYPTPLSSLMHIRYPTRTFWVLIFESPRAYCGLKTIDALSE